MLQATACSIYARCAVCGVRCALAFLALLAVLEASVEKNNSGNSVNSLKDRQHAITCQHLSASVGICQLPFGTSKSVERKEIRVHSKRAMHTHPRDDVMRKHPTQPKPSPLERGVTSSFHKGRVFQLVMVRGGTGWYGVALCKAYQRLSL